MQHTVGLMLGLTRESDEYFILVGWSFIMEDSSSFITRFNVKTNTHLAQHRSCNTV